MSLPPDDDDVGYGRPPKRTQFKKHRSGNQDRRYRKRSESGAEMLTRLLMKPIEITLAGKTKKVPTLEAILLQLWMKEVDGDPRAMSIRLKYQQFAQQHSESRLEVTFVDNKYSEALALNPIEKDDAHE